MALRPLPAGFLATRLALHRVAERLVAPARKPDNEIALFVTPGGFGTPEFEFGAARHRVRVDGIELVHETDGEDERVALTTLGDGAEFLGAGLIADPPDGAADPLDLDPESARALAEYYAFAAAALERLRAAAAGDDPSEAILWPEHFDVAIEAGSEDAGTRANYGASPGDGEHPEPYLYVGPWVEQRTGAGEVWNATAFAGAELSYAELVAADDPLAVAAEFLSSRRAALESSG